MSGLEIDWLKALTSLDIELITLLTTKPEININYQDKNGNTILILLYKTHKKSSHNIDTINKLLKITELLIQNKININLTDNEGNNALMIYCSNYDDIRIIQLLIDAGVNLDEQNLLGETALIRSCLYEKNNLSKYLIDNGANIYLVTRQDRSYVYRSPMTIIYDNNNVDLMALLLDRNKMYRTVVILLLCPTKKIKTIEGYGSDGLAISINIETYNIYRYFNGLYSILIKTSMYDENIWDIIIGYIRYNQMCLYGKDEFSSYVEWDTHKEIIQLIKHNIY